MLNVALYPNDHRKPRAYILNKTSPSISMTEGNISAAIYLDAECAQEIVDTLTVWLKEQKEVEHADNNG